MRALLVVASLVSLAAAQYAGYGNQLYGGLYGNGQDQTMLPWQSGFGLGDDVSGGEISLQQEPPFGIGIGRGLLAQQTRQRIMGQPDIATVVALTRNWPSISRNAAQTMIQKYGLPSAATPHGLLWVNVQPFKYIIVHARPKLHNLPTPHYDVVEHVISYRVPPNLVDDLAQFDGSIAVHRTEGELHVICTSEETNLIQLNLANDLLQRRISIPQARALFGQHWNALYSNQPTSYSQQLQFQPHPVLLAADPDVPVTAGARGQIIGALAM